MLCSHSLGLVFTGSYLEQLNVALLSRPTVFLQQGSRIRVRQNTIR